MDYSLNIKLLVFQFECANYAVFMLWLIKAGLFYAFWWIKKFVTNLLNLMNFFWINGIL